MLRRVEGANLGSWQRLAAVAKYYWNVKPKCISCCDFCHERCDVCNAPRAAKVKVDQLPGMFYCSRKSMAMYHPEKSSEFDRAGDDKLDCDHHHTEWNTFFQEPKSHQGKALDCTQEDLPPSDPKCTLMDADSKKIPELTINDRRFYLRTLEIALRDTAPEGTSDSDEYIVDAVEMEYEAFSSSTVGPLYEYTVLKKIAQLYDASNSCILFPAPTLGEKTKKERPPPKYKDGFCPLSQMCPCLPEEADTAEREAYGELLTTTDIFRQIHGSVQGMIPNSTLEMKPSPATENTLTLAPNGRVLSPSNGADASSLSSRQLALLATKRKISVKLEKDNPKKIESRKRKLEEQKTKERQNPGSGTSVNALTVNGESEPLAKRRTEAIVATKPGIPEGNQQRKPAVPIQDLGAPKLMQPRLDTTRLDSVEAEAGDSLPKNKVTSDPNLVTEDRELTRKKDIAEIVMKYLNPFFRDGRFASKKYSRNDSQDKEDRNSEKPSKKKEKRLTMTKPSSNWGELFKGFARQLTHFLYNEKNSGRITVKEDAQRLIKQLFNKRSKCESETDWRGLLRSCPL